MALSQSQSQLTAILIAREATSNYSHQLLTITVEKIINQKRESEAKQDQQKPLDVYSISVNRHRHEICLRRLPDKTKIDKNISKQLPDEGFESDVDSVSLLSSDGDSLTDKSNQTKGTNISSDSAHSSGSDSSDSEAIVKQNDSQNQQIDEVYKLDNVICYTNVKFSNILGLIIKSKPGCQLLLFDCETVHNFDNIIYLFNSTNNALNTSTIPRNRASNEQKEHKNDTAQDTNHLATLQRTNSKTLPTRGKDYYRRDVKKDINMKTTTSKVKELANKINQTRAKAKNESNFNLLQHTDNNGVTHIEISKKKSGSQSSLKDLSDLNLTTNQYSSIISINTPDDIDRSQIVNKSNLHKGKSLSYSDLKAISQNSQSNQNNQKSIHNRREYKKVESVIGIEESYPSQYESTLTKVWKSAEDIFKEDNNPSMKPERPERRRRVKNRAPPPPDIMKGQYVRVHVDPNKKTSDNRHDDKNEEKYQPQKLETYAPKYSQPSSLVLPMPKHHHRTLSQFDINSYKTLSEFRTDSIDTFTLNRRERFLKNLEFNKWTSSVPRMPKPKMPRSRSENRYGHNCGKPTPYRFVDTTQKLHLSLPSPYIVQEPRHHSGGFISTSAISNRLFGLSQKLKEFGNNMVNTNSKFSDIYSSKRRSSLGDLSLKSNSVANLSSRYGDGESCLKSVIKKNSGDEGSVGSSRRYRNSSEKKVTFSAFATVQVV